MNSQPRLRSVRADARSRTSDSRPPAANRCWLDGIAHGHTVVGMRSERAGIRSGAVGSGNGMGGLVELLHATRRADSSAPGPHPERRKPAADSLRSPRRARWAEKLSRESGACSSRSHRDLRCAQDRAHQRGRRSRGTQRDRARPPGRRTRVRRAERRLGRRRPRTAASPSAQRAAARSAGFSRPEAPHKARLLAVWGFLPMPTSKTPGFEPQPDFQPNAFGSANPPSSINPAFEMSTPPRTHAFEALRPRFFRGGSRGPWLRLLPSPARPHGLTRHPALGALALLRGARARPGLQRAERRTGRSAEGVKTASISAIHYPQRSDRKRRSCQRGCCQPSRPQTAFSGSASLVASYETPAWPGDAPCVPRKPHFRTARSDGPRRHGRGAGRRNTIYADRERVGIGWRGFGRPAERVEAGTKAASRCGKLSGRTGSPSFGRARCRPGVWRIEQYGA
jgi:hypothetical protein